MDNEAIKLLKLRVEELKKLLSDPHPGLMSWNSAVQKCIRTISDYED